MSAVVKFPRKRREFEAARVTLQTSDWPVWSRHIDAELRHGLGPLRSRCRHEAQNSDAFKQFLRLIKANVIGPTGIGLQSQVNRRNGKPDNRTRQQVETEWREFCRPGNCDVTGLLSMRQLDGLTMEAVARDGEGIIRMVPGWSNRWRLALQAIDAEQLDTDYTDELSPTRAVIMGVEVDEWRRPVAYHIRKQPLIHRGGMTRRGERERIPAEEIVHAYLPEWVSQTRGVPMAHTGIKALQHTDGYVEAAVVAARKGATCTGHYTQNAEAEPTTGEDGQPRGGVIGDAMTVSDHEGNHYQLTSTMEPGSNEILPPGWSYQFSDPAFPNVDHGPFVKAMLQWFASGVGVGYNALANDWEGVSYNSLRASALVERDSYKMLQAWYCDHVRERIFRRWLETSVQAGVLAPPAGVADEAHMDRLSAVRWQCRRWDWVDPLKDINAATAAHALGTRSISSIIRERGEDPDDVFQEIADENARMADLGITPAQAAPAAPPEPPAEPNGDPINE